MDNDQKHAVPQYLILGQPGKMSHLVHTLQKLELKCTPVIKGAMCETDEISHLRITHTCCMCTTQIWYTGTTKFHKS